MKNIILYTLILTVFMIGFSCTNLDEELKDSFTENVNEPEVINIDGGGVVTGPLSTAYSRLFAGTGNHNSYFSIQEISTDEVMIPQRGGDWYDGGQWIRMHRHEYTPQEVSFNNTWNDTYGGIGEVNNLLQSTSNPALVAELRVLRAYFYFRLLDTFGRVKIVTAPDQDVPQSSRAELFEFIEDEVNANLDELSTGFSYGRINRWVGYALLAKLYLNAEIYTGTPRWQDAIDAADEVINSGVYDLYTGDYSEIFGPQNAGNTENIWVVRFDEASGQGFNLAMMTLHYASQITFNAQQQPWNGYCTLGEFYNSYEDGDVRKENNFLAGPQTDINGQELVDLSYEGDADPDGALVNFTPEVNELEPNALRQAGARLYKFNFQEGVTDNMSNDYPIFRYADILLTKAEAIARMNDNWNDGDVLDLVNMVRERAEAEEYTSLTEEEFLAERGREMFIESWRRQDLIRFQKYGDEWFEKSAHSNENLSLFPIPQPQIDASQTTNNPLTQNPGY